MRLICVCTSVVAQGIRVKAMHWVETVLEGCRGVWPCWEEFSLVLGLVEGEKGLKARGLASWHFGEKKVACYLALTVMSRVTRAIIIDLQCNARQPAISVMTQAAWSRPQRPAACAGPVCAPHPGPTQANRLFPWLTGNTRGLHPETTASVCRSRFLGGSGKYRGLFALSQPPSTHTASTVQMSAFCTKHPISFQQCTRPGTGRGTGTRTATALGTCTVTRALAHPEAQAQAQAHTATVDAAAASGGAAPATAAAIASLTATVTAAGILNPVAGGLQAPGPRRRIRALQFWSRTNAGAGFWAA